MPGAAAEREQARSRSRGTARRSHRAGREVRETGRLGGEPVRWAEPEGPAWFTRLSTQLQRLSPAEKAEAARLLDRLAGVLVVQSGAAN